MKMKIFISLLILLGFINEGWPARSQQDFDRAAFYNVLKANNVGDIDRELSVIDASRVNEKEAYKGTLLMKKAGLMKKPKEKLSLFKQGRIMLETELHSDSSNTEYHFLRLIIQEHAPKITKYRAQLADDGEYIKKHYKSLLPVVQQIVIDYSKTSAILHTSDF